MTGNELPQSLVNRQVGCGSRPKLLDQLGPALPTKHTYSHWVKHYMHFHNVRLAALAKSEISACLTNPAVKEKVNSSTQNQALSAFFPNTISRKWLRHQEGASASWSQGRNDHRDLHQCLEQSVKTSTGNLCKSKDGVL